MKLGDSRRWRIPFIDRACPECKAQVGHRCKDRDGFRLLEVHAVRRTRAALWNCVDCGKRKGSRSSATCDRCSKARGVASLTRSQAKRPEQRAAGVAMRHAVAIGQIIKPERCEHCRCRPQIRGAIQGHHHKGYAPEHWLDVQWLCSACHGRAHAEINRDYEVVLPNPEVLPA